MAREGRAPLRADVDAEVEWLADGGEAEQAEHAEQGEQGDACVRARGGPPPQLVATVRLRDDETRVDVKGMVGGAQVLTAQSAIATPVDRWLRRGFPKRLPVVSGTATVTNLELGAVPEVCARASGQLDAEIAVAKLFTMEPTLEAKVRGRQLRVAGQRPVALNVTAHANAKQATAEGSVVDGDTRPLTFTAAVPVVVGRGGRSFLLGAGPLRADVKLERAPLALLLGAVPDIARPSGHLTGAVHARGTSLADLDARGSLALQDVSFTLRDPFIRVSHTDGTVRFTPRQVVIERLRTRDRGGSLRVDATVALADWKPGALKAEVQAKRFPLRNEGVLFATIDADVFVDGQLDADPRTLRVKPTAMSILLPDELGHGVQDLAPHPDVVYADQPAFDPSRRVPAAIAARERARAAEEAASEPSEPTPPLVVTVKTPVPFWIRRSDFAVQVGVDVEVRSDEATVISGPVTIQRGFIEMLGKTFQFTPGTVRFAGAIPVDPALDLNATYALPSKYKVLLHVGGNLGAPKLTFSSTDPSASTEQDAIALLMGVRGSEGQGEDQAQDQTRSMLAGMMAGLVGSLARRELGQYVPILAVESGGTAETTRVRAGFQADALIPKSWRRVVQGAYVEGSVGGQEGGGAAAGFLIELFYPHDLSTSATYEQPDNWSLDLLWSP